MSPIASLSSRAADVAATLGRGARAPGLLIAGAAVSVAASLSNLVDTVPLIVASVVVGMAVGNLAPMREIAAPGMRVAATTILRLGIVLLGLRLSLSDVAALGWSALLVIAATVFATFFGVQYVGRRMGLSERLSLLVASGFSICGNSAVAAVSAAIGSGADEDSDDEDSAVAAAVGLVTLCGTLAIVALPAIGSALGLSTDEFGLWIGASVQDTAQVIAVASAAGPSVLAVATAVKLTRVLFLAPIVTGVSISAQRGGSFEGTRPPLVPTFVIGFAAALLLNSAGFVPNSALDLGADMSGYALAMGMVGLGSTVRFGSLRRLGARPVTLGAIAWLIVGGVSLAAVKLLG